MLKRSDIEESIEYLVDGGLEEVIGLTQISMDLDKPKVQMDTSMAMALCIFADTEVKLRRSRG